MTRDEALLKLLAVEPEHRDVLIAVTGWPVTETVEVLDRLVNERKVTYRNGGGGADSEGKRLYYPVGA